MKAENLNKGTVVLVDGAIKEKGMDFIHEFLEDLVMDINFDLSLVGIEGVERELTAEELQKQAAIQDEFTKTHLDPLMDEDFKAELLTETLNFMKLRCMTKIEELL